jgi:hypothetical protein
LQRRSASSMIEMKKGKANLPSHMRSQYKRSQEMEAYRQQMMESQVSKSAIVHYYMNIIMKHVGTERPLILIYSILSLHFSHLTHTHSALLLLLSTNNDT